MAIEIYALVFDSTRDLTNPPDRAVVARPGAHQRLLNADEVLIGVAKAFTHAIYSIGNQLGVNFHDKEKSPQFLRL